MVVPTLAAKAQLTILCIERVLAVAYWEVEQVQLVGYTARRYLPRRAPVAASPPLQRDMNP
jgi:hypothetical protein